MRLRVLTLNVWALPLGIAPDSEERIRAIGEKLPEWKADIVGFQEAWTPAARDTLLSLGARAGYGHTWLRPQASGGSGLLVLSRFPIAERRFEPFGVKGAAERIDHSDYYGGKGFALLGIDTPRGPITLVNTHLHARYAPSLASDTYLETRVAQAVQIAAALESVSDPLVALGDFNLREGEPEYGVLAGLTGWTDVASALDRRQATIAPGNAYREADSTALGDRIDYVFTRDGDRRALRPVTVRRVFDSPIAIAGRASSYSDHAGVWAELELGGPPVSRPAANPTALANARTLLERGLEKARTRQDYEMVSAAGAGALAVGAEIGAHRAQRRGFLRALAVLGLAASGGLGWLAWKPSSERILGFQAALSDLGTWEKAPSGAAGGISTPLLPTRTPV